MVGLIDAGQNQQIVNGDSRQRCSPSLFREPSPGTAYWNNDQGPKIPVARRPVSVADMLIRPVRPVEYERAGAIVVAAYEAVGPLGEYASELADVATRAAEAEVLVALDPELCGCVTFVPDAASPWAELAKDDEAVIRMLGVDPSAQGRGIGRALVEECVVRAEGSGRGAVFLYSTRAMTVAHRIYERLGFVRLPERDWDVLPDLTLLAYRLDLEKPKS
jgi:ribosomal protein S18 acetylase RimI-like enzyme